LDNNLSPDDLDHSQYDRIDGLINGGDIAYLPVEYRLEIIGMRQSRFGELSDDDVNFTIDCIRSDTIRVAMRAAVLLATCNDDVLKMLPPIFPTIPHSKVRRALLLIMGAPSSIWALDFLLIVLRDTNDEHEVNTIIEALSRTEQHVFTVIFFTLGTADPRFKYRLQLALRYKGFEYARPFLEALPYIPDIAFFQETYGADALDEIIRGGQR